MTRPAIVYISGPMTTGGNLPVNVRKGIEAAVIIMDRGYVVLCPHEKALGVEMLAPRSYDEWMNYDYRCIDACDAVYRMPEPSRGGDLEVAYARKVGRPVYYSYDTLFACLPTLVDVAPLYTLAPAYSGATVGSPFAPPHVDGIVIESVAELAAPQGERE